MTSKSCTTCNLRILTLLLAVLFKAQADILPWPVSMETEAPKFVTSEYFLSYGLDPNLIRNRWETFDFNSARLKTLAKALGPAYLRMSGTDGDEMVYFKNHTNSRRLNSYPFPHTHFVMTTDDWDNLNKFAADAKWKLVMGINAQMRFNITNGTVWDPRNAIELLDYSVSRGYASNLAFEFGNEPDRYKGRVIDVEPTQLATEFKLFRELLDRRYGLHFAKAMLIGPDIARASRYVYLQDFLANVAPNTLDAVSWHHYYVGPLSLESYTNTALLNSFYTKAQLIMKVVNDSPLNGTKIWLGETSTIPTLPDNDFCARYVAGFMYLDKLGISAKLGMDVVVRNTFYQFWFPLVDVSLLPLADYWTSLLFHRLVGNKVLDISNNNKTTEVRLYAHCTSSRSHYPPGTVVVYGLNLLPFHLKLLFPHLSQLTIDAYVLSPADDDLSSPDMLLNGVPIAMINGTTLPNLAPARLKPGDAPLLPSKRYGFFVLRGSKAKGCI